MKPRKSKSKTTRGKKTQTTKIRAGKAQPRKAEPKKSRKRPSSVEKVTLGQTDINRSDLRRLQLAWRQKQLVLFLGAGISIPYGIPNWKDLVLELLFEQAAHTRRLGSVWPHYRRALAAWMTDYFEYNPLVLARMVERDTRKRSQKKGTRKTDGEEVFLEKLRAHIYRDHRPPRGKRTTLHAIGNLIQRSRGHIKCAISFNFDDLLEQELAARRVPTLSISDGLRQHSGDFRIIHPHGFVPKEGPIVRGRLVFTEDDYHRLTETVFHWGLSEIVGELRQSTVLFLGLSMSDPSLRRLLDASKNSDIPPHWQVQRRHQVRDHEEAAVINDIENRARRWGGILGYDEQKDQPQLADALHAALKQADTYDRQLFETMGVKTIWVNSFDDIPLLLDRIPG